MTIKKLTLGTQMVVAIALSTATLATASANQTAPLRINAAEKAVLFAQPELTQNLKDWTSRFVISAEKMRDAKAINAARLRGQVDDLANYVDLSQPQAAEYMGKIKAFRARVTRSNFASALEEAKDFQADLNSIPTF